MCSQDQRCSIYRTVCSAPFCICTYIRIHLYAYHCTSCLAIDLFDAWILIWCMSSHVLLCFCPWLYVYELTAISFDPICAYTYIDELPFICQCAAMYTCVDISYLLSHFLIPYIYVSTCEWMSTTIYIICHIYSLCLLLSFYPVLTRNRQVTSDQSACATCKAILYDGLSSYSS